MSTLILAQAASTTSWWDAVFQKDSLAAAIVLAIIAASLKFRLDSVAQSKKARLKLVNAQLKDFYGPLYAATTMQQQAWRAFRHKHWPDSMPGEDPQQRTSDLALWYWWMTDIGMPIHESIVEILHDRSDLIRGDGYEDSFVRYMRHVAEYRVLVPFWAKLDPSELSSSDVDRYSVADTSYPAQFIDDVRRGFLEARAEQQSLIRSTQDTRFARSQSRLPDAEAGAQLT
jgi:hypothetical protein